jgi:hypothetical protein
MRAIRVGVALVADPASLHPAENRGYRELYATSRALVRHWSRLSDRIGDATARAALDGGATAARRLLPELAELTAQRGLHGQPAAVGLGARLADFQNVAGDRFLERNQALRVAVAEVQHLRTLLAYLGAIAESRGSEPRADFCRRWESELEASERAAREATVTLGSEPDAAIEPADRSTAGRAAHRVAYSIGALGEWIDQRTAARRG